MDIKASEQVRLPRRCSHCNHTWSTEVTVTVTASTANDTGAKEIERLQARVLADLPARIEQKKKTGDVYQGVLCSKCGHFITAAMNHHFPNGYAAGMLQGYRRAMRGGLMGFMFFGVVLFFFIRSFFTFLFGGEGNESVLTSIRDFLSDWNEVAATIAVFIMSMVISIGLSYWLIYNLRQFCTTFFSYGKVRRLIKASSDEELLAILVNAYKKNGHSLVASPIDDLTSAGIRRHQEEKN
jgi:hypothetical protein